MAVGVSVGFIEGIAGNEQELPKHLFLLHMAWAAFLRERSSKLSLKSG